ncbi:MULTISPECIES: AAA family ATPase [Mumia]|uniref:AAA family ATPase n=1 Tax=Mumia xiangluensis TaxID=1678900 RepID=A0ABW1QQ29_9ACTN|nr:MULTISPECIES: AAA family ATPase [Mumia]
MTAAALSPPPEEEPLEPTFRRVWQPVDLDAVLSGQWAPPTPSVGRRSDGVGLFYAGKVHTLASESEAGKTWLAMSAVVDEIAADNNVVYLDFEDDEGGVVGRLLTLQVGAEAIRRRFHYLRPTEALGSGIHLDDLHMLLRATRPTLAVLDGVTEAMTLHGMDPLSNKDIATFGRILPRRIADAGPAVVCLDHVVKSAEGRGRYALGGVHKLNALDGAAFVLENRKPFGIGLTGRTTVRLAKDRPGQLRKHGLPGKDGLSWFADLVLTSHEERFAEVEVIKPADASSTEFRPTTVMRRVSDALAEHGPMSARQIEAVVTGKAKTIRDAIAILQVEKYITTGSPIGSIRPFEGGADR